MTDYLQIAKMNSIPVNDGTKIIPVRARYISIPRLKTPDEFTPHNPITTWHNECGAGFALIRWIGRLLRNENITHLGQFKITYCDCIYCQPYSSITIDTEQYQEAKMGYDPEYNILAVRDNDPT